MLYKFLVVLDVRLAMWNCGIAVQRLYLMPDTGASAALLAGAAQLQQVILEGKHPAFWTPSQASTRAYFPCDLKRWQE